jgi:YHS domain-containing protein
MNQVKDPVCGMMVDPETAPAHATYQSQEVFFCSPECRREFEVEPASYAGNLDPQDVRLMDTKSFVAPKLGSAGSGGLEYEPTSERRDRE